jgi:hypothetical protein
VSHQTARLFAGRHADPREGVCVMELASLLSGEPFGDAPHSVCPVLAGFLRGYNDRLDHARRQDLIRFAAEAVGTRADSGVEAARARRCLEFALTIRRCRHRGTRRFLVRRLWHAGSAAQVEPAERIHAAGYLTACMLRRIDADTHRRAPALVADLIALGADRPGRTSPPGPAGPAQCAGGYAGTIPCGSSTNFLAAPVSKSA